MLFSKSFSQTVKDFMNRNVPSLTTDSTLRDAVYLFRKDKIMILPVMDDKNQLLGIMTPSSLFKAFSEDATIDQSILPFMIKQVITVHEDDDLYDVRVMLEQKQVGQTVVLSANHQVSGVLDTSMIIQAFQFRSKNLTNSLESLIQHMPTGIIAIDRNGFVVVANHAAESMCRISRERSIGFHYSKVIPQLTINLLAGPLPLQRMTIENKNLLLKYVSLANESNFWGGIIIIQDLTDYEQIANELEVTKKLERTLQTVLDTTYDGHIVIDQNGIITMINDAACEFIKKPKHHIIHQLVSEDFPEINLEEALAKDFKNEKLEALVIRKHRCLVKKIPIYKDHQLVGAIAKIIYKDLAQWKNVVKRLDRLEQEVSYYRGELSLIGGTPFYLKDILTRNEEMERLKRLARQVAPGFSNILLLGESGTGKELFARGIHAASNRSGHFIKVNCAAIPEDLWESEFFGYADGAFTGAKRGGKPGKFELAHNGTIFLDEIGDMPLSMQVKLLRVLQEREFERVGGTETIRVNVRIIAATNKNLEQMVLHHEFREDLYYRLNVIVLNIPPLRERIEDIPLLAGSITKKFSHLMGLGPVTIHHSAMNLLTSHHWPGNVRELENIIERAMNSLDHDIVKDIHLPEYIKNPKEAAFVNVGASSRSSFQPRHEKIEISNYKNTINQAESEAIQIALHQTGGNRTEAAKLLGISRSQFYKKLKKLGFN